MTYAPIVARLEDVRAIPGADRIVAATASGYRLVVAAAHRPGELGVVFPAGGVLDLRFAQAAGLLMRDPDTGARLTGYLDDPPVVRALTLRGARTDAMWLPIEAFARAVKAYFPGVPDAPLDHMLAKYSDGDEVTPINVDWNGESRTLVVARKYETASPGRAPRTPMTPELRQIRDASNKIRKIISARLESEIDAAMPRHYDTPAAHKGLASVPVGWIVYATHKVHGTSGRTALRRLKLSRLQRVANLFGGLFGRRPYPDAEVVAGTRERIVPSSSTDYRASIRDWLAPRMRPGECLYYEIVGYTDTGKPIQRHRADPKKGSDTAAIAVRFGGSIDYSYGCEPDGEPIRHGRSYPNNTGATKQVGFFTVAVKPQQRVIVYRITQDNRELPFERVQVRAMQIGVEAPEVLGTWHHREDDAHMFDVNDWTQPPTDPASVDEAAARWELAKRRAAAAETLRRAREIAEGPGGGAGVLPDPLDRRHPLEGVVLRCQPHAGAEEHRAFKVHSHGFTTLQGRNTDRARAGDAEVVDVEEQEQETAT